MAAKLDLLSFLEKLVSTYGIIITFEILPYWFDAIKLLGEHMLSPKTATFVYILLLLSHVTLRITKRVGSTADGKHPPTTHVYNKPM